MYVETDLKSEAESDEDWHSKKKIKRKRKKVGNINSDLNNSSENGLAYKLEGHNEKFSEHEIKDEIQVDQYDLFNKKKRKLKKKRNDAKEKIPKKETNSEENNIDEVFLYPYLNYNSENKLFSCSFCNKTTKIGMKTANQRTSLFRHMRHFHKSEINLKVDNSKKYDCESRICKIFYGNHQRLL